MRSHLSPMRLAGPLVRVLARTREDFVVVLGGVQQKSALVAVIPPIAIWAREPFTVRARAAFRLRWKPSPEATGLAMYDVFREEIFGGPDDFGPHLMELWNVHGGRQWDLSALQSGDIERAEALEAHTAAVRDQLNRFCSDPPLNLQLAMLQPEICLLSYPMAIKIPVISFRYFLELHGLFAFSKIRESNHKQADSLIALLYDTLFLQQKTALALNRYVEHAANAHSAKGDSLLHVAELESLLNVDLLVSYLKATIEKTLNLVALTHGISNLDSKKTHKAKLAMLGERVPESARATPYFALLVELLSSENLDRLNNYRTGLLHKKGIAELQPHRFVGAPAMSTSLTSLLAILREEHARNTATLVAALALLADELVRLRPPETSDLEVAAEMAKVLSQIP